MGQWMEALASFHQIPKTPPLALKLTPETYTQTSHCFPNPIATCILDRSEQQGSIPWVNPPPSNGYHKVLL